MKQFLFFLLSIIIFVSCNDELDINDTYKSYPVVYSLLEKNAAIQYVKLNKTFLGDAPVAEMAQVSDSLYFPDADVFITKYYQNSLVKTWKLEKVDTIAKDTGFFANDKNIVYVLNDSIFNKNENIDGYTFRIDIKIPGKDEVWAETVVVDNVRVNSPLTGLNPEVTLRAFNSFMSPQYSFTADNTSGFFEIYLEIYYYEKINDSYIFRTIRKKQEDKKVDITSSDNNTIYFNLNGERFYGIIADNVPKNNNLKIFYGFRYQFYAAGIELSKYIDLTSESYGIAQEKPAYTNINNGWGLFSSRSGVYSQYKRLSNGSLAYFQEHDKIKELNFETYGNTITFYGQNPQYDFADIY
jgi:hypothetical protein